MVGNGVGLARALGHVVLTVLAVVLGHTVGTVLAYLIAGPSGSVQTFVVVQSVVGLLAVLALTRWRTGAGLAAGLPAVRWSAAPALAGFVLVPATWVGRALLGWQLVGVPPVAVLLDAVLWAVAVALGLLWATAQVALRERPLTPYG